MAVVLLALLSFVAAAEPDINSYAARSRKERSVVLSRYYLERQSLARNNSDRASARLAELQPRIEYLQDPSRPYCGFADFDWTSPTIGAIGRLDKRLIDVAQILGSKKVRITLPHYEEDWDGRGMFSGSYSTERGSATGSKAGNQTTPAILEGVSTAGWVDGESRIISGVFTFSGTERYTTAGGGTNTEFVIRLVDISKDIDKFTGKDDARQWKLADGRTVSAVYVKHEKGAVELWQPGGARITVKLADLDDESRKYVRDAIKESMPPKTSRAPRK